MQPEWFQPFLNQGFSLTHESQDSAVDGRLVEVAVRPDPRSVRKQSAPFVLLFETLHAMPQGRYRVTAPDERVSEIFMTPVVSRGPGYFLEAVFN